MELKKYIGSQIKEFRLKRGMNQEHLAELLETTKQTVSRYEKGDRTANQDILFQLSDVFNVCIDDFFPNREGVLKEQDNIAVLPVNQYPYLPTTISAGLPLDIEGISQSEKISIPDVIMGKWSNHNDIFITKVNGDSMNKVMPDRSLIAVKPIDDVTQLNNGDIVVYKYDNEYAVKRYYNHGNGIIAFKPDSYDLSFDEKIINTNDGIDLKIKGKVALHIVEHD